MKLQVTKLGGTKAGDIELDDAIFAVPVRADIMHRMINWQLAKRQAGTHHTKTRAEVSGTGKKPWRQKGTGRARAGDLKRPQDRQGGVAFGPRTRSHAFDLPKKIRALALKSALSSKLKDGKLVVLDEATAKDHKTKPMAVTLAKMNIDSALIISGAEIDANFARATSNIPKIDVLPVQGLNVYDILRRETLVMTKEAVETITARLKGDAVEAAPAKAEKAAKKAAAPKKAAATKPAAKKKDDK
ncbi:MAG: 50S ribosomal protein L4 [Rhodospirillales bacterium]|nr:50S ribosomal protein L4 [Rhodospirillales bacterium]